MQSEIHRSRQPSRPGNIGWFLVGGIDPMALREIGEDGSTHDVSHLPHRREFDATWLVIPAAQRAAIEAEINRRLDELISSPDPNWGSITNTSIEGGRANPATGEIGVEQCSSPSTRLRVG